VAKASRNELGFLSATAAVVVYGIGDLVSGLLYEGYSFRDQAISELTAFGSPVRHRMVAAILIHGLLLVAFGIGVWRSADRRSLHWVGALLIGRRGRIAHSHDLGHELSVDGRGLQRHDAHHPVGGLQLHRLGSHGGFGSRLPGWFRLYSIATLLVLSGFGAAASIAMQAIEENVTPWAGGFERINAYAYFAWLVVLALTVLSRSPTGVVRQ